jgi:pimeloyl-ACP methyl ester carboxylesterase
MPAKRPIVLIHGWSDSSRSFKRLQQTLRSQLGVDTHVISLADWISMHDDVSYPDLGRAMEAAWRKYGLPTAPRAVDLIVHSTGALVTREWMTAFYAPTTVPVHRLLMLAPANFGSQLAHKGQAFIGRVVKGWKNGFRTGEKILRGLELASPYTWQLAERDLFGAERWYGRDRILATVLIGNSGYSGISSIANEAGSDGTVRLSTGNLLAAELTLDLSDPTATPTVASRTANAAVAFGVLDRENHSTIALKDTGPANPATTELILAALQVQDADYPAADGAAFAWQARLDARAWPAASSNRQFQNTVVHLCDDLGHDVGDFFFEFYREPEKKDARFESRFYREVVTKVHPYERNIAYRSLYLDIDALKKLQAEMPMDPLYISVAAAPEYAPPRTPVGYRSLRSAEIGQLSIPAARMTAFFAPHRTLFVRIRIARAVAESVFQIHSPV